MALKDIDTFVIVMLENRSFDHMCGYLSLPDAGPPMPVDGLQADKAWLDKYRNDDVDGTPKSIYRLADSDQNIIDPPHEYTDIGPQIATPTHDDASLRMGGFVKSYWNATPRPTDRKTVMGYYDKTAVPVFDFFARNFAICDHWFSSLPAGTQANRLMAMSGTSQIAHNVSDPLDFPDQPLVYDWVKANLGENSWCSYQWAGLPFFALMMRWLPLIVAGHNDPDNLGVFRRYDKFADQWNNNPDAIPNVVFVEPRYTDDPTFAFRPKNDDHCPTGISDGQKFLADIYNTVIANEDQWMSTMMIVTYDEHGGFFDHVPPMTVPATAGNVNFQTTGVRVPSFVISPYVKPGSVFSDALDGTSVLQLLADRFTPGKPYSAAVAERQKYFKPLSAILDNPAITTKPKPINDPVLDALTAPHSPEAFESKPSATGQAFGGVAARLSKVHPDLIAKLGEAALTV
jgi:phospholipase C